MPAYTLFGFFSGQFALTHVFGKESRQFSDRHHMQLEHQFDALDGGLAVRIEEEDSGVVDEDIHHIAVGLAPIV